MEIKSRPMTIEEQFFKPSSNAAQHTINNAKSSTPVIKPVTLVTKPDLTGKQLHSPKFLTKVSNFVNRNYLAIIGIALVGGGVIWFYKVKKNKAVRDAAAVELANQHAAKQAAKNAVQSRQANPVGEQQTYQNASNEDSIDVQAYHYWKKDYQQPI